MITAEHRKWVWKNDVLYSRKFIVKQVRMGFHSDFCFTAVSIKPEFEPAGLGFGENLPVVELEFALFELQRGLNDLLAQTLQNPLFRARYLNLRHIQLFCNLALCHILKIAHDDNGAVIGV